MDVRINDRFYKFYDNKLQEFRIVKINNENSFTIENTKGTGVGASSKVSKENIEKEKFTKLNPDAVIDFMIVEVTDKLEDVMVTVTKKDSNFPYIVCRQSANDIFAQMMNPQITMCGVCVSRDTCPSGVNFDDFLVNTKVKKSKKISYYIGDTLDYILTLLRDKKDYDDTLLELFRSHALYVAKNNKYIAKVYENRKDIDGYYKTLLDLLESNNFEYELLTAFGIVSTSLSEQDIEGGTLSPIAREVLSSIMDIPIDKSLVVEYDKDIDLDSIKRKYILMALSNKKVYVVAYTLGYQDRKTTVTKDDGSINIADSMRAFDKIAFNKEKYHQ